MPASGVHIGLSDLLTVLDALADAAEYRGGERGSCADCGDSGLCEDDQADLQKASRYDQLRQRLQQPPPRSLPDGAF